MMIAPRATIYVLLAAGIVGLSGDAETAQWQISAAFRRNNFEMDAPTAAGTIGISLPKLELLRRNAAFPSAISDDGAGNMVFDDAAVAVFAWLYRAAIGNGWLMDDAMLLSADFATLAATQAFAMPLVAADEIPSDALDDTLLDVTPLDALDLLE